MIADSQKVMANDNNTIAKEQAYLKDLKRMAPWIEEAKLETSKSADGSYKVKVEVFLKRQRHLVAIKKTKNLKEGLDKAKSAIWRQVKKIKDKHKRKRSLRLSQLFDQSFQRLRT